MAEEAAKSDKMLQDNHRAFRNALLAAQLAINQVRMLWHFLWSFVYLVTHTHTRESKQERDRRVMFKYCIS